MVRPGVLAVVFVCTAPLAWGQGGEGSMELAEVPRWSPAEREARMEWWREARFGLFIHWGPVSLRGTEISWSRIGHPYDHPSPQHETVPPEEYDGLYRRFDPTAFDADAWMALANEAGCGYVVFTAKHHDGFSMWPTELRPDYSISATPFGRDICGEIAEAAHRHGIRLGWYYSTRDWTHPQYLVGDNASYNDFYEGQVRELLTRYGDVDIMWFDHVAGNWRDYTFGRLFGMMYGLHPDLLVNDRAARFIRGTEDQPSPELADLVRGDWDTPEQHIGTFQRGRAWESCVTMTECADGGGWSYRPDGRTRTLEECLRMLIGCVTGDGNLLLNVGPLPTGEIAPDQVAVLRGMGAWLRQYGESLYGTRGGPWRNGEWGGSTCRGERAWLHILRWPGETLRLPSPSARLLGARMLSGGEVSVAETPEGLEVHLAQEAHDPLDTIVELTFDAVVDVPAEGLAGPT